MEKRLEALDISRGNLIEAAHRSIGREDEAKHAAQVLDGHWDS